MQIYERLSLQMFHLSTVISDGAEAYKTSRVLLLGRSEVLRTLDHHEIALKKLESQFVTQSIWFFIT